MYRLSNSSYLEKVTRRVTLELRYHCIWLLGEIDNTERNRFMFVHMSMRYILLFFLQRLMREYPPKASQQVVLYSKIIIPFVLWEDAPNLELKSLGFSKQVRLVQS